MKRFFQKVLAKASIVALVFGSLAAVAPVHAASMTGLSDTLSRHKASTSSTHTVAGTVPASSWTNGETIVFDYGAVSFTLGDETPSCTIGTGTCTSYTQSATDTLVATCTATNGCSGALSIASWTATNPSAGSVTVALAGDSSVTGNIVLPILDDDQVTVTATVAQTMSFDLDVGTAVDTDSSATYTVALGTLSTSAVSSSGDGSINMIGIDLDTNASGGAVVQVKNANGSNGLVSASVSGDNINTFTGTLSAAAEGYGICVNKVGATTGTLETANFHQGTTLSATDTAATSTTCTSSAHKMPTALTTTFQDILNSHSGAIAVGRAEVFVKASISVTTAAHDDYSDTLTFRATATF